MNEPCEQTRAALASVPRLKPLVDAKPIVVVILVEIARLSGLPCDENPRLLMMIEKLGRIARDVQALGFGLDAGSIRAGYSPMDGSDASYSSPNAPMSAAMGPAENFGTVAIQQLVSSLSRPKRSPVEVVEAIAMAKKSGLDDVAEALTKELIGQKSEVVP